MDGLTYTYVVSEFISSIVSVSRFNKLNRPLKVFTLYISLAALVDTVEIVYAGYAKNNVWMVNILNLLDGIVFLYIILTWSGFKLYLQYWLSISFVYLLYWTYSTLMNDAMNVFNSQQQSIKGLALILLSGISIFRIINYEKDFVWKDHRVIILSAILIYYFVTLFPYLTSMIVLNNHEYGMNINWSVVLITGTFASILFTIGILCFDPRKNTFLY